MKKNLVFVLTLISCFFIVGCKNQMTNIEFQNSNTELTDKEKAELDEISVGLSDVLQMSQIKEKGKLSVFTKKAKESYDNLYGERLLENEKMFLFWKIDNNTKISDLAKYTQQYMDNYYDGINISGADFQNLVMEYYTTDLHGLAQKSQADANFGKVYLYTNIYFVEVIDNPENLDHIGKNESISLSDNIMGKKVIEYIKEEMDQEFLKEHVPAIVHEVLED